MAHTHGAECERLHELLDGLKAQLDTSPLGGGTGALPDGSVLPPISPDSGSLDQDLPQVAVRPSPGGDEGALDLEIADIRQALADMGCDRKAA